MFTETGVDFLSFSLTEQVAVTGLSLVPYFIKLLVAIYKW